MKGRFSENLTAPTPYPLPTHIYISYETCHNVKLIKARVIIKILDLWDYLIGFGFEICFTKFLLAKQVFLKDADIE